MGLSVYTGLNEGFGETYGPLTAVMALLLWSFLTSIALFIGLAVAAQLEASRTPPHRPGPARPRPDEGGGTGTAGGRGRHGRPGGGPGADRPGQKAALTTVPNAATSSPAPTPTSHRPVVTPWPVTSSMRMSRGSAGS